MSDEFNATLCEVDLLRVKVAAYEFELLKQQLERTLSDAVLRRDKVIDPIVDSYRNGHIGKLNVDISTGNLVPVDEEE